jgi:hypothetical protein
MGGWSGILRAHIVLLLWGREFSDAVIVVSVSIPYRGTTDFALMKVKDEVLVSACSGDDREDWREVVLGRNGRALER